MVEPFAMASLPVTLVTIATALFVTITIARLPTLSSSPSPCHPHPPCRLPPSLPTQLSPPPSPLLLLTLHPHPPHCLPHSLPPQLLPPPSPSLLLALHPCLHCHSSCHHCQHNRHRLPPFHHCNCALCCLCLHSPATLVTAAPPQVGERRTIPTLGLLLAFV